MLVINREELKADWPWLIAEIQKNHEMHPDVYTTLFHNPDPALYPQKNLAHSRGYFCVMESHSDDSYYLQFTMEYIIQDVELQLVGRSLREVIFYDGFVEYEAARIKQLSSVSPDQQDGLNLN